MAKDSNAKAKKNDDVIVESSKKRINKRNTGPPNNLDLSDVKTPVRPQVQETYELETHPITEESEAPLSPTGLTP